MGSGESNKVTYKEINLNTREEKKDHVKREHGECLEWTEIKGIPEWEACAQDQNQAYMTVGFWL